MLKEITQCSPRPRPCPRPDDASPAPVELNPEMPWVASARGAISQVSESHDEQSPFWADMLVGLLFLTVVGAVLLLFIRCQIH